MKTPSCGFWRPLRYLLILATAGAVIAADNSWLSKVRFDFADATNWLATFYSTAPEPPAVIEETAASSSATLTMDSLLNGYLFAKPTTTWQLDSSKQIVPMLMAATASGPVVQINGSNTLPTASFSSGFVSYSNSAFGPDPAAPTVSGAWTANASGNWGDSTNWAAGIIADGAGNTANFSLTNISTDVTVILDTSRTIGRVDVGDTNGTHHYTIAPLVGSTLAFDSGIPFTSAVLQQSSTSAGDTISAPLRLDSNLDVNNLSTTKEFLLSGNISAGGGVSSNETLWFNQASGATGKIRVTGNITDGGTGGEINVVVGGGTVVFTGINTYQGSTSVDNGTLLINGNNSAATGTVFVSSGGTLGGTGTVGGDVYTFGGTITGATSETVGTLTLQGDLHLYNGEVDGIYLANLSGSTSDLLAITGTMFLGGDSALHIVGGADGFTTYTLATFGAHDGIFDPTLVTGIPTNYALIYHDTDLQLVPIPEPATWAGGALAVGAAVLFARRKRLQRAAA